MWRCSQNKSVLDKFEFKKINYIHSFGVGIKWSSDIGEYAQHYLLTKKVVHDYVT